MDRERLAALIDLTVEMAHDYALETRIRCLVDQYAAAGDQIRTLVMNADTWKRLVWEAGSYRNGLFWTPAPQGSLPDPDSYVTTYLGIPILVKEFMPDMEVVVGV